MIFSNKGSHTGYGAGSGNVERYECACAKGKIIEEHDNIPGFRDHSVYMLCDDCKEIYDLDTNNGVRRWELKKRNL